jgi:alpha-amylase
MNWEELEKNSTRNGYPVNDVLEHWQKLGQFRRAHPAVGAGVHQMISREPYYFKRTYQSGNFSDVVVVGLNLNKGIKEVDVGSLFGNGSIVRDYYSDQQFRVNNGKIKFNSDFDIVLIGF